jgi:metal-responsive CopG/Arc/MetJ family transcriptional regulator
MARPVLTKPSGKGKHKNGRRHLNASLPQQLVFDFNHVAKKHGHGRRDALVEEIFRRFLETVEPDSESLRQSPSNAFVKPLREANFSSREAEAARHHSKEQEAIRIARERALEIVDATSAFITRKPPKRSSRIAAARRKQKAS